MVPDARRDMITIRDVARHAQDSVTTVSHVSNGARFVSEEAKARVKGATRRCLPCWPRLVLRRSAAAAEEA
jgi:hypothetical protein